MYEQNIKSELTYIIPKYARYINMYHTYIIILLLCKLYIEYGQTTIKKKN